MAFYQQVLNEGISDLQSKHLVSLNHIPVFISGMASSSIGILNLTYGELPFATDGSEIKTQLIKETKNFKHDILLISGIKSTDDVMRGEETQLIGCISELEDEVDHQIFILPGTHLKHITVESKQVTSFKTYMTGELFSLLSKNSVLSTAIEKADTSDLKSFKKGVKHSTKSNLLHSIFRVRTNHLFEIHTKKENFNYLSGLLIGTELLDLLNTTAKVYICCSSNLKVYYETALEVLNLHNNVYSFSADVIEQSVIKGQYKIFSQLS